MPAPSTIEVNTKNLQDILDKAKDKNINLTVQFLGGHYELYTCIIYDNTTIKMTNNTELENQVTTFTNKITSQTKDDIDILFMNAKPVDSEDSNITGYNGRSNIVIDGGVINCRSAIAFCHGQNITIKNIDGNHVSDIIKSNSSIWRIRLWIKTSKSLISAAVPNSGLGYSCPTWPQRKACPVKLPCMTLIWKLPAAMP